jgi:hypothetical protein
MRGGSDVVSLCEAIEEACNLDVNPLSLCICYKVQGDVNLYVTALADEGAPNFMVALAHYLLDFDGKQIAEYERDVLQFANMDREEVVVHVDVERYQTARSLCDRLYKRAIDVEYLLILLECPFDYKQRENENDGIPEDEYVHYVFRETVTEATQLAYPIMCSVRDLIKERLK